MEFDRSFLFGTATSSYQIEGAVNEDGRTPSIWDTFSREPGRVLNGDTGDVACDHYHRFREDVKLMKELGVDAYRFSISWSRVFSDKGKYNEKGMEFYKNLVKALNEAGIKACATLYHWDLPQWLQDRGGWEERESVEEFKIYAEKCFQELGDGVATWITHNEPWCAAFLSNMLGVHAPGKRSVEAAVRVAHHLLVSHTEAVRIFRKGGYGGTIGITLNLTPVYGVTDKFEDQLAANNMDGHFNRWFLDPLFKGSYPTDIMNLYATRISDFSFIKPGDVEGAMEPCDFLGINYYNRSLMQYDGGAIGYFVGATSDYPKTDMGWDISPKEFIELIQRVRRDYTELPIYITENGSAWEDTIVDGKIEDTGRVDFLNQHLEAISELNKQGLNVAGYYCWSFMDNFEWGYGYSQRFGIVHVDYETLERTPKSSFFRYQEIIRSRK